MKTTLKFFRVTLFGLLSLMQSCTTSPISYSNEDLYTNFDNLVPSAEMKNEIAILTWNIQFGFADSLEIFDAGARGAHEHLDNLCEAIKSMDSAIVGLQELAINLDESIVQDQARYLADCLNMNYAVGQYSSYHNGKEPFVRGVKCLTILTKYEILTISNIEIYSNQPDDRRTVLVANLIDSNNRSLNVLNMHISSKSSSIDLENQLDACTFIYSEQKGPSVFLGDFNISYYSKCLDGLLNSGLFVLGEFEDEECNYGRGWCGSTTSKCNNYLGVLIDHILVYTSAFEVNSHCLIDSVYWSLSDHKGVVGKIELR
ncbi:MAG: endonuclease/exonuclease/phosphatase family metal-dependent hydrolase [Saprospiraceae bacterium]|jgi:endonuclease/exonuclease/phosphatase family metal-dependent hydrolase